MADVKDVTIRIKTIDGDLKKTGNEFDNLNNKVNTGSKKMSGSMSKLGKSIAGVGAAMAGAFAIKAVIGDAVKRIVEFEKSMSSLSAITGATGDKLGELKGKVLEVSKNTKKSAVEVAKSFELIGSKAPKLLENADALAKVTEKAIILSKASGEDLVGSSTALTGVMNQFNLEATESERIINALAAGSQKGAAPVGQISQAIDRFGTVANSANVSVESSIGLVETLAEKNINGAEAGTQLRNIILKLQAANIGFTDGVFNLNDALQEVKDKNLSAAESAKLFGLESVTAGNILVDNVDTVNKYTDAVTGTNTANEQAAIQMDNVSGKVEELDATYETFILSIEDGSGVLSDFVKGAVEGFSSILEGLTDLNQFDFGKIFDADSARSFNDSISELGISINKIFNPALAETGQKLREISNKNLNEITDKFKTLSIEQLNNRDTALKIVDAYVKLGFSASEARDKYIELKEAQNEGKESIEGVTEATEGDTDATEGNTKSKNENLTTLEKQIELQKKFKAELEKNKGIQDDQSVIEGEEELYDESIFAFADAEQKKTDEAKKANDEREAERKMAYDAEVEANIEANEKKLKNDEETAALQKEINQRRRDQAISAAMDIISAIRDINEAAKERELQDLEEQEELDLEKQDQLKEQQAAELQRQFEEGVLSREQLNEALDNLDRTSAANKEQIQAQADKKEAEVKTKAFNREKKFALIQAAISTAQSILASAKIGFPAAIATVALSAALGAVQIGIIASQKAPKFKKGKVLIDGEGTETSDSIHAMISKNESVINAKSSKKHTAALKAINDDRFDEYLNRVLIKQMYSPHKKDKIVIKEAKRDPINFPKSFRVSNAKAISNGIREAMEEYDFLNKGNGWD